MSEKLTPQQKLAVEDRGGKLLVSAAAGSGKTKVLVDRLMSYLTNDVDPANLDDFLIITYTKAAAAELRGKISDKLTGFIADHPENKHMQQQIQRLHLAKISTVHAFCADILREYAYRLDISSDFRIAEENECQEMMHQILQQLLDEAYLKIHENIPFQAFVDTQGLGRDDRQVPEIILQIYASALCHLDPNAWLDWCLQSANVECLEDAGQTMWGKYLIADFKAYLNLQISSLEKCVLKIQDIPGMEKPAELLKETVNQLISLNACDTWDSIASHNKIDFGRLTFSKEHRGSQLADQIKAIRKNCKEGLEKKLAAFSAPSAEILSQLQESSLAVHGLVDLVKAFRTQYENLKRVRRVLDFSDIEQKTLDVLLGKTRTGLSAAADEIGSRFREIMVDEYQDSNEVQDAIFSALTHRRQNCFMVGDVKQSIYQFRLADPSIFLEKYNAYLPAEDALPGDGRKVLLSSNFRSSNGVIQAVNDVFTNCMSPKVGGLDYTESEMLREGIPHIPLPDHEVELYGIRVSKDTYQEEATFTAQRIQQLLDGKHMVRDGDVLRPIVEDDIVILLRSPGSVGGEFRYALEQAGIPCTMGADVDLLQTPEVGTLCSILQIIHNPLQDIPLIAALTSPVFGFTADDLAQIRGDNRYCNFYKAIEKSHSPKATMFLDTLQQLRKQARFLHVSALINQVFLSTGMLNIYGAMVNGEDALQNLQDFCQLASQYESSGRKDLSYFLEYLTSIEEKGLTVKMNAPTGSVRIMSIHKSKGLEFPVVFLCGLSRSFNTSDATKQVLCHKDLGLGLTFTNTTHRIYFPTIAKRAIAAMIRAESISEELRVLYVAMTRARDRLIMTYAARNLDDQLTELALRLDLSDRDLLTAYTTCPGTWVLISALKRTEAGAFFNIAMKPDCSSVQEMPWTIQVKEINDSGLSSIEVVQADNQLSEAAIKKIQKGLSFQYPYSAAAAVPSKLTATQLKGRSKDQEVAELAQTAQKQHYHFRSPLQKNSVIKGTEFGNAMHNVMQYLKFDCCGSIDAMKADVARMEKNNLITHEQAEAVDLCKIHRFFQSDLGKKIVSSKEVLREFKFSILDDACNYYDGIQDDKILLQGVIDCALVEEDGITVLDFKTDYISDSNLAEKTELYTPQIQTYIKALEKIYNKPVTHAYIYFFSCEKLISIQ